MQFADESNGVRDFGVWFLSARHDNWWHGVNVLYVQYTLFLQFRILSQAWRRTHCFRRHAL